MSPELDAFLCSKFPKIFADRRADCKSTAMCWGFECDDGWFNIIYGLCLQIQNYCDAHPEVEQVTAMQVKEKFGTLRFYIFGGNDFIDKLIGEAEELSSYTCEVTGWEGNLFSKNGWLKTLHSSQAVGCELSGAAHG